MAGVRCSSCEKFVSLETQEPEVSDTTGEINETGVYIQASATTNRNCAECSDTLKSLELEYELEVPIEDFKGYSELSDEDKVALEAEMANGDSSQALDLSVEEDSTEADESGGGRYKKNLITSTVHFSVVLTWTRHNPDGALNKTKLTYSGHASNENAASEFEEC